VEAAAASNSNHPVARRGRDAQRSTQQDVCRSATHHAGHADVPAGDHLANADAKVEGLATLAGRVELGAAREAAIVVRGHGLAARRHGLTRSVLHNLLRELAGHELDGLQHLLQSRAKRVVRERSGLMCGLDLEVRNSGSSVTKAIRHCLGRCHASALRYAHNLW